ncbi:MAG: HAMP domain-containing histidine kinase, partial [Planctomycetes bacterium]|nr:HAMP domain-containing histidine kinase [Planctomycetota bacterium]
MSNTTTTQERLCNTGAGRGIPRELLVETLARVPSPIVVDDGQGELFLNRRAQSLWPNTAGESPDLPITRCGKKLDLMALQWPSPEREGSAIVSQVRVPGGGLSEVELFSRRFATDSPVCRVAILRPPTPGGPDGALVTDKVTRLKAIVHEIRNMLTSAREALVILEEGVTGAINSQQRRFLHSAVQDVDGMVRAMVELSALWTTQAGVMRMKACPVDIRSVVEQLTMSAYPIAAKRGIALRVEIDEPSPCLTGDQELLVQAVRNVLTNALQHTPAGGEIRIRAFTENPGAAIGTTAGGYSAEATPNPNGAEEAVVIELEDTGPGITLADQERVFQTFERGASGDSARCSVGSGGMGMGLAIARDVASAHGGTLDVRSEEGKGSCFTFRFPKSQTCPRSWMVRATQRAIADVHPLRVPLAVALLRFDGPDGESPEALQPDLLFAAQQVAIQSLRSTDTFLAVDGQLLLLIRGSTRSAAYAMIDRILQSMVERVRSGWATSGESCMTFGVASYPEDGEEAAQ